MEKENIIEKLQDIIREAVDDEEVVVNDATVASDVEGWDSITQILIIGEIQNAFGVKFTSSEIDNFINVGELADAIIAKI